MFENFIQGNVILFFKFPRYLSQAVAVTQLFTLCQFSLISACYSCFMNALCLEEHSSVGGRKHCTSHVRSLAWHFSLIPGKNSCYLPLSFWSWISNELFKCLIFGNFLFIMPPALYHCGFGCNNILKQIKSVYYSWHLPVQITPTCKI